MSEDHGVKGQGTDHHVGDTPMTASGDDAASLRAEIDRLHRELAAARSMGEWRAERRAASMSAAEAGSDAIARLALLEAMLETVPIGVVLADAQGRIVHGNAWVERMLKHPVLHSADTASYGEWVSFHADGRRVESHEYPLSRVIRDGVDRAEIDVHYRRGDGTMFWMRVIGEPVHNAKGERVGATVALVDIDDEVRLLAEKEMLLGEVNHRVKNSLQLVSSILTIGGRLEADPAVQRKLKAAADRVRAVATVHATLYQSGDVRTVALDQHLAAFCRELAEGGGVDERGIRVEIDLCPARIGTDKAVALSLIVNELITNSLKYAFPDDDPTRAGENANATPTIRLLLERETDGKLTLTVSDNGVGGTESASVASSGDSGTLQIKGLGSRLVPSLATQINARMSQSFDDGWTTQLTFDV